MKNSVLKRSLSLASTGALALASLVGLSTPANAAAGLTIEVADGAGFTFVEGSSPVFVISGNADFIASNGSQLRVKLTNMDAITSLSAGGGSFIINGTTLDSNYAGGGNGIAFATSTAAETGDQSQSNDVGTASGLTAVTAGATTVLGLGAAVNTMNVANATSLMTSPFTFKMSVGAIAADLSDTFKLTAWADADNDGVVDAGEVQTSQDITFIDIADVTAPVAAATPLAGGDSFAVTLTSNINLNYLGTDDTFGIYVTDGTNAMTVKGATSGGNTDGIIDVVNDAEESLNTAKTKYTFTVAPSTGGDATGNIAASGFGSLFHIKGIFSDDSAAIAAGEAIGTAVIARTGAVSVSSTESVAQVVRSANAKATSTGTSGTSSTADVRKNTEFTVLADFEDTNGANIVGKSVTWTASASPVLTSAKYVTINGTNYTTTAALALAEVAATTNASGRATLTVSTTGFAAEDTVTITATADGIGEAVTATAKTAAYTAEFKDGSLASNTGYGQTMAIGGSLPVVIAVADQWGVAPADGVQRVSLSRAVASARTTAANWSYTLPVVGGLASGTIVDNGAGAGSDTVTATLAGTGGSGSDTMTLTYATAAASTVTTVEVTDNQGTGDSTVRQDADALPSWHYHLNGAVSAPDADTANFVDGATTGTSDTLLAITGTAKNAAGVGVSGRMVTVSATGITFKFTDAAGNTIYSKNSINVPTTAGGAFTVYALSDGKGGTTTFTASVDAASGTTAVAFAAGTATAMSISAPATAATGRAVDVIATLTDVAGDPVAGVSVSFTALGVGYLSSLTGTTDALGRVVVKLITQPGENGAATITATATLAGVSTAKTATVSVGTGAAASSEQKVNAGSFKGYVALYAKGYAGQRMSAKVGADWVVVESLASDFERVVEFTGAGYTISVPIYIDRVLVDTITVTTK